MQVKGTTVSGIEKKSTSSVDTKSTAQAAANKYNADGKKKTSDTKSKMEAVRSNNQNSAIGRAPTYREYVASTAPVRYPESTGMATNLKTPLGYFATNEEVQTGKYLNEASIFNSAVDYLDSGNTDYNTTQSWLAEVNKQASVAQPSMAKNSLAFGWRSLRNALIQQAAADNANRRNAQADVLAGLADSKKQAQNALNSARAGQITYEDGLPVVVKASKDELDRLQSELDAIIAQETEAKAVYDSYVATNPERDELINTMETKGWSLTDKNFLGAIGKGGLTQSEQERLTQIDAQLGNTSMSYGWDFVRRGGMAKNALIHMGDTLTTGLTGIGKFVFSDIPNAVAEFVKPVDNWLYAHSDLYKDLSALGGEMQKLPEEMNAQAKAEAMDHALNEALNVSHGKGAKEVQKGLDVVADMVPYLVVAHIAAGASATDSLAQLSTRLAKYENMSGTQELIARCADYLKAIPADANFDYSFGMSLESSYSKAIEDGATPAEAVAYAMLNSWANAIIEVGGEDAGLQSLPEKIQEALKSGDENKLWLIAQSIASEAKEEVWQGSTEQALEGSFKDVNIASVDDPEAVISGKRAVEEAGYAALGAGVVGGVDVGLNTLLNGGVTVDKNGRIVPVNAAPNAIRDMIIQNAHNEGVGLDEDTSLDNNAPSIEEEEAPASPKEITPEEANNIQEEVQSEEAQQERNESGEERAEEQAPSGLREETEEQERNESGELRAEENAPEGKREIPQERNEAGENRAEDQAPIGAKVEAEVEEQSRNEAGEQRAEEQTPKGPKTEDASTASETAIEAQEAAENTDIAEDTQKSVKPTEAPATQEYSPAVVKMSAKKVSGGDLNNKPVAQIVSDADPYISSKNPVKNITGNRFAKTNAVNEAPLSKKVADYFKKVFGGVVRGTKEGSPVIINERGIKDDISHGIGDAKAATFEAIPDVLRKGEIISRSFNSDLGNSYTIAGKIILDGTPVNVYCVVKRADDSSNRFYLHEVTDGQGNLYYRLNAKEAPSALRDSTSPKQGSAEGASKNNIAQNSNKVNGNAGNKGATNEESRRSQESQNPEGLPQGNQGSEKENRKFIASRTKENEYVYKHFAPGAPIFTGENAKELSARWQQTATNIEMDGGRIRSRQEVKQLADENKIPKSIYKLTEILEKVFNVPITFCEFSEASLADGFVVDGQPDIGMFLAIDEEGGPRNAALANTMFHELSHVMWARRGEGISRRKLVSDALIKSKVVKENAQALVNAVLKYWGAEYVKPNNMPVLHWLALPDSKRLEYLNRRNDRDSVVELMYEEIANVFTTADPHWLEDYYTLSNAIETVRDSLVENGIYTQKEMDVMLNAVNGIENELYSDLGIEVLPDGEIKAEAAETQMPDNSAEDSAKEIEEKPKEEPKEEPKKEPRPTYSGKSAQQQQNLKGQTQTSGAIRNSEERARDISEKFGISDGTYQSATRKEVSRIADYCIEKYGLEEEWDRLVNKKDWDRVDFSEAGKIVLEMTKKLNRDMTISGRKGLGPVLERKAGESDHDYNARQKKADKEEYLRRREPIDALLQAYADQKSVRGQELQEKYNFSTADELRMKASQRFLSYTEDGEVHNANEWQKSAKMWRIMDDLLTRAEKLDDAKDIKGMVDFTKMVGRIRGRENLLGKSGVKAENFMYARMIKNGLDAEAMTALMYGNINKIMDDLTPMSYAEVIQSVRMTNMLSNIATGINNLLNNAVSLRTNSIAQNASMPFAKQFEKLTGKKVAVGDTSLLRTQPVRRAEELAYEYAVLSSYYGINEDNGRIDIKSGTSGFNPNGNWFERALARYNFFVNAFVLSPDAPAKARAEFGIKQGIEERFKDADMTNPENIRNKKELEGYAHKEAQRRTLQDDNAFTNAVLYIRDHFLGKAKTPGENKMIRGRRLGSFKLGEFMLAFAKVPTNVGIQKVAATPFGALYHTARYAYGLAKAKANPESMTVNEMAKISRDIGRAATTTGMIALGAMAAMTGALKNFDDTDDDDEKRLAKEKGYSGLTFNLSALFHGGEWRDGDTVISGNFLEILATPLTIGAIMWDAYKEGMGLPKAIGYGTLESFAGMVDAVMDIPGLQQVGELYTSFANQNPNDKTFKRTLKAIGQFAVSSSTSYFMPNIVSQANAGFDNRQRDVYTTNSYGETLRNIVMNKIPGLRQKLPEKTDTFGNSRTYADSRLMSVINTVLLPGDIKKYHVSEMEQELLRLNKEGYKSKWFDTAGPKTIEVGDNEYALDADERRAYHMTKAKYLVEAYDAFRTSDIYKTLSDEERASVYKSLKLDAERMTKNDCLETAGLPDRAKMDKWESLTGWDNKISYLVGKQLGSELWDDDAGKLTSFTETDAYMKDVYGKLPKDQRDLIDNSLSHFDDIYDASKHGIGSKMWQEAYNIYKSYNSDEGKAAVEGGYKGWEATQMWTDIANKTGANDEQMKWFEENMKLYNHIAADSEKYHVLVDSGWDRNTAQSLMTTIADLQPANGNSTVSYKQRLTAIAKVNASEVEKWDAFYEYCPSSYTSVIRNMTKYRNLGYSYEKALRATKKWMD